MASPEEMAQTMRNNIPEKTGKSQAEWNLIIKAAGLEKHGQIVKMLKTEHGVTHGFANLLSSDFLKDGAPEVSGDDLVAAQYEKKPDLKPIYDKLLKEVKKFGKGMEIVPKKAYVSLRHNKQFALIQPSTKTRLDVGINLKGTEPTARLESSGSFNAMVSHRVRLTDSKQVDKELIEWLKAAYTAAG
ncbi:DUF5655 domain-containing protein [Kangiella sp. TOML190]|uniref:DUF5655 domain-containing protein n=1 Tax=Kangiella sp. TOML190 TaxID=2931351 RepID=UPI00204227DF|nr:DUF5655 domain-containing protein [Kangiella sp. TOML190]